MRTKIFLLIVIILGLIPLVAMAKDKAKSSSGINLSGNWKLERVYERSSDGSPIAVPKEIVRVLINQNGNKLRVIMLGLNSALYDFTGTITGNKIRLVYSGQGGFVEVLTGTISADRKKIGGTLDVNWHEPGADGKDLHHYGKWKLYK